MFKVDLIGNIGIDARKENANGNEYIFFSVAHNRAVGETKETIWVNVYFPIKFENTLPYLKKGTRVYVRGNFGMRMYHSSITRQREVGINIYGSELEILTYKESEDKKKNESTENGKEENMNDEPF